MVAIVVVIAVVVVVVDGTAAVAVAAAAAAVTAAAAASVYSLPMSCSAIFQSRSHSVLSLLSSLIPKQSAAAVV